MTMQYEPIVPRARIGFIIPSSNRMVEQEMIPSFPEGVHVHVTRLRMTGANRGPLDQHELAEASPAVGELRD